MTDTGNDIFQMKKSDTSVIEVQNRYYIRNLNTLEVGQQVIKWREEKS